MFLKSKKGVSMMVSYVLLVVIAIALSVAVSSYLARFLPSERTECPPDINLFIEEGSCSFTDQQLSVTISNRGLFNISAMFVRFSETGREVRQQVNKGQEILPFPIAPNSPSLNFLYDLTDIITVQDGVDYILEVQPGIVNRRIITPCEKAIITQIIQCSAGGGGGGGCTPTEDPETSCGDGNDNDCDGNIDCADPDCASDANCQTCQEKTCEDYGNPECGIFDNGCDGTIDCGGCGDGEYCDSSDECRTFLSCADDYGNDEGDWYNNNTDYWPQGVYKESTCTVVYKKNNNDRTENYDDWCTDARNLTQYHCVDKTDDYGKNYKTCEKLDDTFYDTDYFDCFNYNGPHCIIDEEPIMCYEEGDNCDYNPPPACDYDSCEGMYGGACFCWPTDENGNPDPSGEICIPPFEGDTPNDGAGAACTKGCQG